MEETAISSIYGNFFSELSCFQVVTDFPFMEEFPKMESARDRLKTNKRPDF